MCLCARFLLCGNPEHNTVVGEQLVDRDRVMVAIAAAVLFLFTHRVVGGCESDTPWVQNRGLDRGLGLRARLAVNSPVQGGLS